MRIRLMTYKIRHGGVVGADTAAIYRQTELARQMLADDDRGALPPNVVSFKSSLDPRAVRAILDRFVETP